MPGVLVRDCSKGWQPCFAETRTDENGHFAWENAKPGKHYLRLSLDGCRPEEIIVIVEHRVKTDIRLKLEIAA
jgi:hypothetical protein